MTSLGADELIDYRATDFAAHVDGVDVVLDTIGADTALRSIGVLRPGGLLVTIVGRRDADLAARTETRGRRFAGLSCGTRLSRPLKALDDPRRPGRVGEAARVHRTGHPGPGRGCQAHELLESGSATGKIALTGSDPVRGRLALGLARWFQRMTEPPSGLR